MAAAHRRCVAFFLSFSHKLANKGVGIMDDLKKTSITDDEIERRPAVGRRRLLTLAAGSGAGLLLAACQITTDGGGPVNVAGTTDSDNGNISDPVGGGRGYCRSGTSGVTDLDSGQTTDPGGNGRGGPGQRRAGVTDADTGNISDPVGAGRGRPRGSRSGTTDADGGGNCTDPGGNGRNA